jgi:hypothetical protein
VPALNSQQSAQTKATYEEVRLRPRVPSPIQSTVTTDLPSSLDIYHGHRDELLTGATDDNEKNAKVNSQRRLRKTYLRAKQDRAQLRRDERDIHGLFTDLSRRHSHLWTYSSAYRHGNKKVDRRMRELSSAILDRLQKKPRYSHSTSTLCICPPEVCSCPCQRQSSEESDDDSEYGSEDEQSDRPEDKPGRRLKKSMHHHSKKIEKGKAPEHDTVKDKSKPGRHDAFDLGQGQSGESHIPQTANNKGKSLIAKGRGQSGMDQTMAGPSNRSIILLNPSQESESPPALPPNDRLLSGRNISSAANFQARVDDENQFSNNVREIVVQSGPSENYRSPRGNDMLNTAQGRALDSHASSQDPARLSDRPFSLPETGFLTREGALILLDRLVEFRTLKDLEPLTADEHKYLMGLLTDEVVFQRHAIQFLNLYALKSLDVFRTELIKARSAANQAREQMEQHIARARRLDGYATQTRDGLPAAAARYADVETSPRYLPGPQFAGTVLTRPAVSILPAPRGIPPNNNTAEVLQAQQEEIVIERSQILAPIQTNPRIDQQLPLPSIRQRLAQLPPFGGGEVFLRDLADELNASSLGSQGYAGLLRQSTVDSNNVQLIPPIRGHLADLPFPTNQGWEMTMPLQQQPPRHDQHEYRPSASGQDLEDDGHPPGLQRRNSPPPDPKNATQAESRREKERDSIMQKMSEEAFQRTVTDRKRGPTRDIEFSLSNGSFYTYTGLARTEKIPQRQYVNNITYRIQYTPEQIERVYSTLTAGYEREYQSWQNTHELIRYRLTIFDALEECLTAYGPYLDHPTGYSTKVKPGSWRVGLSMYHPPGTLDDNGFTFDEHTALYMFPRVPNASIKASSMAINTNQAFSAYPDSPIHLDTESVVTRKPKNLHTEKSSPLLAAAKDLLKQAKRVVKGKPPGERGYFPPIRRNTPPKDGEDQKKENTNQEANTPNVPCDDDFLGDILGLLTAKETLEERELAQADNMVIDWNNTELGGNRDDLGLTVGEDNRVLLKSPKKNKAGGVVKRGATEARYQADLATWVHGFEAPPRRRSRRLTNKSRNSLLSSGEWILDDNGDLKPKPEQNNVNLASVDKTGVPTEETKKNDPPTDDELSSVEDRLKAKLQKLIIELDRRRRRQGKSKQLQPKRLSSWQQSAQPPSLERSAKISNLDGSDEVDPDLQRLWDGIRNRRGQAQTQPERTSSSTQSAPRTSQPEGTGDDSDAETVSNENARSPLRKFMRDSALSMTPATNITTASASNAAAQGSSKPKMVTIKDTPLSSPPLAPTKDLSRKLHTSASVPTFTSSTQSTGMASRGSILDAHAAITAARDAINAQYAEAGVTASGSEVTTVLDTSVSSQAVSSTDQRREFQPSSDEIETETNAGPVETKEDKGKGKEMSEAKGKGKDSS